MRIRSIKPEFWKDEKIASFPYLTRLVYIALWNESDDQGRLRGNPTYLKSVLFPYDDVDMKEHLESLSSHGMISEYSVRDQSYLYLANFTKHQRINRPSASKLPDPSEADTAPPKKKIKKPRVSRRIAEQNKHITEPSVKCDAGTGNREQGGGTGNMSLPASEPVPSAYKTCIGRYFQLYEIQSGGKKPRWNARNGRDLKVLLAGPGGEEILERMDYMFEGRSWLKPPYTFGSLVTNWDSLVPAKHNGRGSVSGDDLRDLAAELRARGE